ncbi:receptor-type tyrosine-protein phosphatase C-like isoform X2 [Carassius auratus]|uniref:Receptor-type tyrosine-protein phosphatase C n=1 Tax=Carassius auratus TaxID=7957 RepID=A0A6P6J7S8_CARAU|nr:receptor-type tyrosine-protein phosphatase C-like isoform X2 [Carassius auratus]
MARFFTLGPLVLVLCLVLYPPNSQTEGDNKPKTDVSADQSKNATPPTAHIPTLPTTKDPSNSQTEGDNKPKTGVSADQSKNTTPPTAHTPTLPTTKDPSNSQTEGDNKPKTGVSADQSKNATPPTAHIPTLPTTKDPSNSQTEGDNKPKTGVSADQSKNTTPPTAHIPTLPTTKVPQSDSTTSSNTSADIIKESGPSPSRTPTQTSQSTDNDTQPGSSKDSITSPPNTTTTSLTSTQPSSTLHTSTSITESGPSPSHTPTQTSQSTDEDTQPSSSNGSITSPPNTTTTSLTSTQTTSTLHTSTSITDTTEGPCQYSVLKSVNKTEAHVVNITGSKDQNYTIRIKDKHNETRAAEISNQTVFKIPFEWLKPCTVYTVSVDDCELSGNNIFTSSKKVEALKKTVVTSVTDNEVCLKGELTGIQWNLTECVKITEQNSCAHTHTVVLDTCNYTMNVTLPPVKPKINFKETIPSQFEWMNKPERCNAALLNISCINDENKKGTVYGLNTSVLLLLNTHYSCTGEYPREKQPIKSNELDIQIKCDWQKKGQFQPLSSSSLEISWTSLEGDRCSGIEWDSYSVSCKTPDRHGNNHPGSCTQDSVTSTVCRITGLLPYTDYECSITGTVNQKPYVIYTGNSTTLSDKPIFQSEIEVIHPSHNSLEIKCENKRPKINWNGGEGTFQAEITYNGEPPITKKPKTKCSFHFQDLYYLTTYKIQITAKNKEGHSAFVTSEATTQYNDKAVVGFLVFLIIVTSVALLFVLFKIYLLKRKRATEDEEIPLTPEPLRRVEPIYADGLVEAYKTKIADESRLFMDEFQSIPRIFSNYTVKEAKKQENQSKNRYVDILPYDYNRVTLSAGGEDDYINASFIEGYQEPKKYIAAQGPKDETVCDFWQMVWEQKSSIIVMVTRCEEGNKVKCAQYWPSLDRETEIFDDFVVKIRSEQHCPDYIVRHLILANKREKASEREVTHIQFISWPDHGVPGDPCLLLKLRRRVNSFKNFFSGPIVIHCSAGVGRTGTYIGIDAMIESLEAEGRVDIYGYVAKLRRQRCLMVQVEAQYVLIHTALIEHHMFGETEVSLSEFHSALNTLRQKDGNDPSLLEMEFQKLPKFKKWRTCNTASSEENKKKNRNSDVIPYDFNRVLFRLDIEGNQTSDPEDEEDYSSDEEEESNEYINASFISGYWCQKSLIATQGPLPNTTGEFLLMLYQQQTKTLVMLTDCQEDSNEYCSQYWGDEKKTFGEMEIEVKKTESFPTYVRRRLEIKSTKKTDVLEVDQYQFLKWKGRELPENPQELIEMIRVIRENSNYDNSKMNRNIPMVVHCNNGSSRTGVFCALWNLLDSAYTEKLVDVFHVVKNLRKERQGIIETIEQYKFLYEALEGAFPVQNGAVKTPPANDTAQVINETTALLGEPNDTSGADQKESEESKAKESSEQKAKESGEQKAEESSEQKPKESSEQKTKESSEQKAEESSEQKPKESSEQKTKESSEQKPKESSEQKPEESSEQKPKESSEQKPEESSEQKPKESSEQEVKESSTAEAPPAEGEKPSTEGTTNGPTTTVEL